MNTCVVLSYPVQGMEDPKVEHLQVLKGGI